MLAGGRGRREAERRGAAAAVGKGGRGGLPGWNDRDRRDRLAVRL